MNTCYTILFTGIPIILQSTFSPSLQIHNSRGEVFVHAAHDLSLKEWKYGTLLRIIQHETSCFDVFLQLSLFCLPTIEKDLFSGLMSDPSLWNIPEGVGLRYTCSYHVCGPHCSLQCSI